MGDSATVERITVVAADPFPDVVEDRPCTRSLALLACCDAFTDMLHDLVGFRPHHFFLRRCCDSCSFPAPAFGTDGRCAGGGHCAKPVLVDEFLDVPSTRR
jgi:hypothetical protein